MKVSKLIAQCSIWMIALGTSAALAGEISFEQPEEKISVRAEYVSNELCKAKNALTDLLSNEFQCTSIRIDYDVIKGAWFSRTRFSIAGSANCPGVSSVGVMVEVAPCEECVTKTSVSVHLDSGRSDHREIETSEAKFGCR